MNYQLKSRSRRIEIFVSSVKPFKDEKDAYTANQVIALNSWKRVASKIILFNKPEDLAEYPLEGIEFRATKNPEGIPYIKEMVGVLAKLDGDKAGAILNGDIVVEPEVLKVFDLREKYQLGRAWGCTSRRHRLSPAREKLGVVEDDWGLDFFLATGQVWKLCEDYVPDFLTVGRGQWDNWMVGWMKAKVPVSRWFDITNLAVIWHKEHSRKKKMSCYSENLMATVKQWGEGMPKTIYPVV